MSVFFIQLFAFGKFLGNQTGNIDFTVFKPEILMEALITQTCECVWNCKGAGSDLGDQHRDINTKKKTHTLHL